MVARAHTPFVQAPDLAGCRGCEGPGAPLRSPPMTHSRSTPSAPRSSKARPGTRSARCRCPRRPGARSVRAEDQNMFDGMPSEQKDPRKSIRVEDFPLPELAPDEAIVAVMASSINFNTVWTSIFEPLPDVRVPEAPGQGERVGRAPRPAVPRDGERRVGRRAADGLRGAQLEARRRGHGALQLPGRPGPVGARRRDDGGQPAHLGLRVELRRARRPQHRQGEPAHAEARAPHVGRGRGQRADATPRATG